MFQQGSLVAVLGGWTDSLQGSQARPQVLTVLELSLEEPEATTTFWRLVCYIGDDRQIKNTDLFICASSPK